MLTKSSFAVGSAAPITAIRITITVLTITLTIATPTMATTALIGTIGHTRRIATILLVTAGDGGGELRRTAKFDKLAGDKLGRAMLLEAKLGMCVQVLPPGGHFAVKTNS
jgi:hypothetical protein